MMSGQLRIADLLVLTAVIAVVCWNATAEKHLLVRHYAAFTKLPTGDQALVSTLRQDRWTEISVQRNPPRTRWCSDDIAFGFRYLSTRSKLNAAMEAARLQRVSVGSAHGAC